MWIFAESAWLWYWVEIERLVVTNSWWSWRTQTCVGHILCNICCPKLNTNQSAIILAKDLKSLRDRLPCPTESMRTIHHKTASVMICVALNAYSLSPLVFFDQEWGLTPKPIQAVDILAGHGTNAQSLSTYWEFFFNGWFLLESSEPNSNGLFLGLYKESCLMASFHREWSTISPKVLSSPYSQKCFRQHKSGVLKLNHSLTHFSTF